MNIVLRSTFIGQVSSIFWSGIWLIALFNRWMWSHTAVIDNVDPMYPFYFLGLWVTTIVMVVIVIALIESLVYAPLTVNVFLQGDMKHWKHVSGTTHSFPFSKSVKEAVFDRIIDFKVTQSSIDRIFDTGSLSITMVTFTNGESVVKEWKIPAIEHPFDVKAKLLAASPIHEGIEINLRSRTAHA